MAIKVLLGTPALNGSSGVQSVTGDGVDNTDPSNPSLSFPDGTQVELVDGGGVSVTQAISDLDNGLTPNHSDLNLDDGTNPHNTTKSDVSLGNVDNTSDVNKPISTATQTSLDKKVNSVTTGEPTGSDVVLNVVSLTQAEYDAGTPIATTIYNITDA